MEKTEYSIQGSYPTLGDFEQDLNALKAFFNARLGKNFKIKYSICKDEENTIQVKITNKQKDKVFGYIQEDTTYGGIAFTIGNGTILPIIKEIGDCIYPMYVEFKSDDAGRFWVEVTKQCDRDPIPDFSKQIQEYVLWANFPISHNYVYKNGEKHSINKITHNGEYYIVLTKHGEGTMAFFQLADEFETLAGFMERNNNDFKTDDPFKDQF
jgi:hypothetical protein